MRHPHLAAWAAGSILLATVPLAAHHEEVKPLIRNAWVREILPGQGVTAVFLEIENPKQTADFLIDAACECAKTMEIHRTVQDGGEARMQPVEQIKVPAGGKVELAPGGDHLMLLGTEPLRPGDMARIRLRFTHAGDVWLYAPVRASED